MEEQRLLFARSPRQNRRQFLQKHQLILYIIILLLVGILLSIIQIPWSNIVSVVFTALAVLLAVIQWLFPEISTTFRHPNSLDPPHYFNGIVRRRKVVSRIYAQLIHSDTSAIILRGLNGVGASTLARQVFFYEENQLRRMASPFSKSPFWIELDANASVLTVANALALPDLSSLYPQQQAEQLIRYLNTPRMRRLIVLDFKNPLNMQTREALADRPGFKEFLRILNSNPCECRILLTSRPWSSDSFNDSSVCIKEYYIEGLSYIEGKALFDHHNIEGTDDELYTAIELCGGHAGALTILPKVLKGPPTNELPWLLEDPQIWMREISKEHLDHIYQELSPVEREMLFAFSIYRKPVRIEAMQAVLAGLSNLRRDELKEAFPKLIRRSFFLNLEKDAYQLHPIVAYHAQNHFGHPGQTFLQEAHSKAAHYYQTLVKHHIPLVQYSERSTLLIEAVYHLHRAGEDQEAHNLLQRERLLPYLL